VKSISELIGILIVIGIVVALAVAVAIITGGLTSKATPKGSTLSIQSAQVIGLTPANDLLLLKMAGSVSGTAGVTITGIVVSWDTGSGTVSVTVTPRAPQPGTTLVPGAMVNIEATFQTSTPPGWGAKVWVTVMYCDTFGSCGSEIVLATLSLYT